MGSSHDDLEKWRKAGLGKLVLLTFPSESRPVMQQIVRMIGANFKVAVVLDEKNLELEFFWSPLIARQPKMVQEFISLCVQQGQCEVAYKETSILGETKRERKIFGGINLTDSGTIPVGIPYQIPATYMSES